MNIEREWQRLRYAGDKRAVLCVGLGSAEKMLDDYRRAAVPTVWIDRLARVGCACVISPGALAGFWRSSCLAVAQAALDSG